MMFRAAAVVLCTTLVGVSGFMPTPNMRPDGMPMIDDTQVFYSNDPWNSNDHYGFVQGPPPMMMGQPHPQEMMYMHPAAAWEQQQMMRDEQQRAMYDPRGPPMQDDFGGRFYDEPNHGHTMMPPYGDEQQMMMMNNNNDYHHHSYDPNNMVDRSFQPDTPLSSNEASPSGASLFGNQQRRRHGGEDTHRGASRLGKPMEFAFTDTNQDPRETVVGPSSSSSRSNNNNRNVPNGYDATSASF